MVAQGYQDAERLTVIVEWHDHAGVGLHYSPRGVLPERVAANVAAHVWLAELEHPAAQAVVHTERADTPIALVRIVRAQLQELSGLVVDPQAGGTRAQKLAGGPRGSLQHVVRLQITVDQ